MELTISTPRLAAARILPRTPRAFYRTAINAFFFVMGMVFASWAVRIPDIKAALQMSDAALGSVLLAAPLGEMLSIAPTAWLIGRFRSRRVIMLGLMLMPCALLSLALAGSPHWLAAALLGCCSMTAFAADDPLEVVNNLSEFIFGLIRAVGLILLGWGIVQVGLSLQSHDPSQRSNGFLTLAGGIVITFSKEILTLITG